MENCRMPWTFSTFYCHQTPCLSTWGSKFQLSYNEVKVAELNATVAAQTKLLDASFAKFALFSLKSNVKGGKKASLCLSFPFLIICITYCTEYLGTCYIKCHDSILGILLLETRSSPLFFLLVLNKIFRPFRA